MEMTTILYTYIGNGEVQVLYSQRMTRQIRLTKFEMQNRENLCNYTKAKHQAHESQVNKRRILSSVSLMIGDQIESILKRSKK